MGSASRRVLEFLNRELEQLDRRRSELAALRAGMIEELRASAEPVRKDTLIEAVVGIISAAGSEMKFAGVMAALVKRGRRADPMTLRKAMATAATQGRILRSRHGYYTAMPNAVAEPQLSRPRNVSPVTDITRRPHRLEVLERVPMGWRCPRCGLEKRDRLDFALVDCRR